MTFFIDDMSMPEVNKWTDQPTLELMRQLVEYSGFCFLDKDKRGDFKTIENLQYTRSFQEMKALQRESQSVNETLVC